MRYIYNRRVFMPVDAAWGRVRRLILLLSIIAAYPAVGILYLWLSPAPFRHALQSRAICFHGSAPFILIVGLHFCRKQAACVPVTASGGCCSWLSYSCAVVQPGFIVICHRDSITFQHPFSCPSCGISFTRG